MAFSLTLLSQFLEDMEAYAEVRRKKQLVSWKVSIMQFFIWSFLIEFCFWNSKWWMRLMVIILLKKWHSKYSAIFRLWFGIIVEFRITELCFEISLISDCWWKNPICATLEGLPLFFIQRQRLKSAIFFTWLLVTVLINRN